MKQGPNLIGGRKHHITVALRRQIGGQRQHQQAPLSRAGGQVANLEDLITRHRLLQTGRELLLYRHR